MTPQKFTATTMREALQKVREAMGEDAIILKSERVKAGGMVNFLKQDLVEVTAAPSGYQPEEAENGPDFANSLEHAMNSSGSEQSLTRPSADLQRLQDELKNLREQLADIGNYVKYSHLPVMPRELTKVWESLGEAGVDNQWATDLAQSALVQLGADDLISAERVEQFVLDQIAQSVRPAPRLTGRRRNGYKVMMVGLPGAGKTTLIQKLASDPAAYGKRKLGLFSLDTHRMAAIEQMKAFARISGAPLETVYRPDQAVEALQRLVGCEAILIDTAGLSLSEQARRTELAAFISEIDPDEIHHVQNSMIRDDDLIYANECFRDLSLTHLSFTRLDESRRHGFLINIARAAGKPIAWLSRGQAFVGQLERYAPEHLRQWMAAEPKAGAAREVFELAR
ncbi:50S ribosome-binding GTPase [candidate division KSB1 bacterium]|nr:50S ribosome-binding GTPase [candidate division KSB1 bacterium]